MKQSKLRMPSDTFATLSSDAVDFYQANGFVRVREMITRDEAAKFRQGAMDFITKNQTNRSDEIFVQMVNVWREDAIMKQLTFHPNITAAATRLAGAPLRLWHDQILTKKPGYSKATEFHQDQPYWPHANSPHPISCWIALCDVPVERGCMTFLPSSQKRTDLEAQNLASAQSLFSICLDFQWNERITVPLQAGDCTFHHGRCAHMATPNLTDEPRVAHVAIFMDAATQYSGKGHFVTDPLGLTEGDLLDGEMFPEIS
ncbi:MAG: phytanoyl-CoA dioxygenase family protein [Abditibacteriaceae bacterium]